MGFSAIVYTKEEARAMPPEKRPICYRIPEKIYTGIFEAVGAASLCWQPKPEGVFDTEQASKFATDLCFKVAEELERLGVTFDQLNKPE
jgi:hypothetical protein